MLHLHINHRKGTGTQSYLRGPVAADVISFCSLFSFSCVSVPPSHVPGDKCCFWSNSRASYVTHSANVSIYRCENWLCFTDIHLFYSSVYYGGHWIVNFLKKEGYPISQAGTAGSSLGHTEAPVVFLRQKTHKCETKVSIKVDTTSSLNRQEINDKSLFYFHNFWVWL